MIAAVLLTLPAVAVAQHGGGPPGSGGPSPEHATAVSMTWAAFEPGRVDVLPGEEVRWTNGSARAHVVEARDRSFDSGRVSVHAAYARRFEAPGVVAYHCRLHPTMEGEVGVFPVLLEVPQGSGRPGGTRVLEGRSSLPPGEEITIEGDTGEGFAPVATATVETGGAVRAEVAPTVATTYRPVGAGVAGPAVRLDVVDRHVAVRARSLARRALVEATVTPAEPGAHAVLQLRLAHRFGWWPVAHAELDHRSRARFRVPVRRRVPARVVVTLPDGATVVATSPVVQVGHRRR